MRGIDTRRGTQSSASNTDSMSINYSDRLLASMGVLSLGGGLVLALALPSAIAGGDIDLLTVINVGLVISMVTPIWLFYKLGIAGPAVRPPPR